ELGLPVGPAAMWTQPRRARRLAGRRRPWCADAETIERDATDQDHGDQQDRQEPLAASSHRATGFRVTHSAAAQTNASSHAWIVAGSCAPYRTSTGASVVPKDVAHPNAVAGVASLP